jgi:hypothetical protein
MKAARSSADSPPVKAEALFRGEILALDHLIELLLKAEKPDLNFTSALHSFKLYNTSPPVSSVFINFDDKFMLMGGKVVYNSEFW